MALLHSNIKSRADLLNSIGGKFDKFCKFTWGETNMWTTYHAFVIADNRDSLKFYAGNDYSNEYSKPQFNSNLGNLVGVNFTRQTVSFKVGLYLITEDEYRRFLNEINAYEVRLLSFDFNPYYGFFAKLKGQKDSNKTILGEYLVNNVSTTCYYTEVTLTFELQGGNFVRAKNSYEINKAPNTNDYTIAIADAPEVSDLDTPMIWNVTIVPNQGKTSCSVELQMIEEIQNVGGNEAVESAPIQLFSVSFGNIDLTQFNAIHLQYDSNTGLVTFTQGNKQRLLTLLSTNSKGEYFVKALQTNMFLLPGKFNNCKNYNNFKFSFNTSDCTINSVSIECYARTNLL